MQEYVFSLTRILPNKGRIYNSVLIRENTSQRKPIFWNVLCWVVYCHTKIACSKSSEYQIIQVYFFSCQHLQRKLCRKMSVEMCIKSLLSKEAVAKSLSWFPISKNVIKNNGFLMQTFLNVLSQ